MTKSGGPQVQLLLFAKLSCGDGLGSPSGMPVRHPLPERRLFSVRQAPFADVCGRIPGWLPRRHVPACRELDNQRRTSSYLAHRLQRHRSVAVLPMTGQALRTENWCDIGVERGAVAARLWIISDLRSGDHQPWQREHAADQGGCSKKPAHRSARASASLTSDGEGTSIRIVVPIPGSLDALM